MPAGDRLPQETVDLVIRLYVRERRPRSEVARLAAVSPVTVTAIVKARGYATRSRGGANRERLPHYEFERTRRMYEQGASEQEIAVTLGVSRGAVQWRLEQAGVARRSRAEANRLAAQRNRNTGRGPRIERGERHWNAKLTEADVAQIRGRAGSETQASLAREFGVTEANVSSIVRGKTWVADGE